MPGLTDRLYSDLVGKDRLQSAGVYPFRRDGGALGDAFTASALLYSTGEERWLHLVEEHINRIEDAVFHQRADRVGLSNGLTGALLLLDTAGPTVEPREEFTEVLERRVETLADMLISRVRGHAGVDWRDYSYATGLAGVAHRCLVAGRCLRLAQRIANLFADLATGPFPYGFWTPTRMLPGGLLESTPQLSFGGRPLGFGMGIAGVVSILREASVVFGGERYLDAAGVLVDAISADIGQHDGAAVSVYQAAPQAGEPSAATRAAEHSWATGLPGVESAVADSPWLMQKLYPGVHYARSYVDPDEGGFMRPGVCNGVAGRLYLADLAGLPDDTRWDSYLGGVLSDYVSESGNEPDGGGSDPGFWEGVGGVAAVWFGRHGGRGYAPALEVLGARNTRRWSSAAVGGAPGGGVDGDACRPLLRRAYEPYRKLRSGGTGHQGWGT